MGTSGGTALAGVVASLVLLGLSGCAATAAALIDHADGDGSVCTPRDADGRAAIGISQLENRSSGDVSVTAVELIDPDAVELLGLELRPASDPDANIVGLPYDRYGPAAFSAPATIAAGEAVTILVGVGGSSERAGSAAGVRITYAVEGLVGDATVETTMGMELVPTGQVCRSG